MKNALLSCFEHEGWLQESADTDQLMSSATVLYQEYFNMDQLEKKRKSTFFIIGIFLDLSEKICVFDLGYI